MDSNKIFENVKMKIAISNSKKEDIAMEKRSINILKKLSIAVGSLVAVTGIVFANDIGNIFRNIFGGNASDGVQIAVENGYIHEVEPTYIEADGIEIAVDSFLIDDYNFDMNFRVKLSDKYDTKEMQNMQLYDLKVIDENEDVVFLTGDAEREIAEEKETLGTPNFHPLFWGGYGMNADITGQHELILHLAANGTEEHKIPKSKKLYVTFSRIVPVEYIFGEPGGRVLNIYTGDWKFELDVPEEMYKRENVIYKMKSCNEKNIKVDDAILSNTAFKIRIPETTTDKVDYDLIHTGKDVSEKVALGNEYVVTTDGKRFEPSGRSDADGYGLPPEPHKIIDYSQTFNLTKFDATDELTVHIFTNKGEEIIIEYERSK